MNSSDPVVLLNDPEVRSYLVAIIGDSSLSADDKYQQLQDFFRREKEIRQQITHYTRQATADQQEVNVSQIVYQVSKDLNIWDPEALQEQILASVRLAVRRLFNSQHPDDGGWGFKYKEGFKYNESDVWGTTHALLCLNAAQQMKDLNLEIDIKGMIERGICYLAQTRDHRAMSDAYLGWSVDPLDENELIAVYELSMVIRCYYQIGPDRFDSQTGEAVGNGLNRLENIQNADGGWEKARNRGDEIIGSQLRSHGDSEVGATSFAIQALSMPSKEFLPQVVQRGIDFLLKDQTPHGSWYYRDFLNNTKKDSISKTADALQALAIARQEFNLPDSRLEDAITRAIEWLKSQQKPVLNRGKVGGWGWLSDGTNNFDMENTCLILEASVRMSNPYIPLLSTSAQWLLAEQYKENDHRLTGPKDVGKWPNELTGRIANSLIHLYNQLSEITVSMQK